MEQSKIILCVDDDPIILHCLNAQLGRELPGNFIIECVESGEEGLSLIESISESDMTLALVISDWYMNGMSGNEFIKCLREKQLDVPVVVLSGQTDLANFKPLESENSIQAVVGKPWDGHNLIDLIKSLLHI
jgi:CheY-like chemotaxis protein